jgi:DNA-binding PucR family transcriptional regulator
VTKQQLTDVVRQRIAGIAATLSADELGEAMADSLIADIPEFRGAGDDDVRAGLVVSCTSNLEAIKQGLIAGSSIDDLSPPPGAIAWAHELVHRGMPLAALLRAYRLGHELFERTFAQAVSDMEPDPDVRWRALSEATRYMFGYIDVISTQLVDDYETERAQWLRGAAAAQAELIHAIVDGQVVDEPRAIATLGHELRAPQVGFIVWREDRRVGAAADLAQVARALAMELGGTQTLLLPLGEHVVWAWTAGGRPGTSFPKRSTLLADGIGAAVGTPHPGIAGMSRSHHEARAARRVGDLFGSRPGAILRYHAVALHSLISADPAQAASFAATELGELGGEGDPLRRLRATLATYLDERLSPARTARRLGIHHNTVVYRVKRAEELLGHAIDDRRLELEIALRLFDPIDRLRAAGGSSPADDA